jgi:hypothetical protein
MKPQELKRIGELARERQKEIETLRKDPRYLKVVGRLVSEKLLIATHVRPTRARPTLGEALWAGESVELRILELLPAILIRKPRLLLLPKSLPEDLALVIRELKRGKAKTVFRGVPPEKYAHWVDRIGRGKTPRRLSMLRTHRFTGEDIEALQILKERWNVDETSALRRAILIASQGAAQGSANQDLSPSRKKPRP